jgi:hypothetical protein
MNEQELFRKRDAKVKPHLSQYAPVWIIDEKIIPSDESVMFSAIFQHNLYGWVNRRYVYDGFNDVLYHKGQIAASDETIAGISNIEPYLVTVVSDIPNAYGG